MDIGNVERVMDVVTTDELNRGGNEHEPTEETTPEVVEQEVQKRETVDA